MSQVKYRIPLIVKSGDWWGDNDPDVLPATPQVAQRAADDFNSDDLAQYSDKKYLKKLTAEAQGDRLIVTAEIEGKATAVKIAAVRNEIGGQCSDGWGEGFEQQEFSGPSLGYPGYSKAFISTWARGREPEVIED